MEINSLGTLVRTLKEHLDNKSTNRDENETQLIDSCARIFEDFNKSNEMQFRFQLAASFLNDLSPQEKDVFFTCLNSSWSFLIDSESSQAKEKSSLHSRQIAACLNSIRIISRDSEAIKLFENAKLLEIIQTIANLMMCLDDKNMYIY